MEKINHSQLELFSQTNNRYQPKNGYRGRTFFNNIKNHEKKILATIGFIIIGVVSFTLGVEKGKKMTSEKINSNLDLGLKQTLIPNQPVTKKDDSDKSFIISSEPIAIEPRKETSASGFTIQVATYRTETFAQREAESLKKRGLLPLVLSKSGFSVLCVGKFPDKDSARSLLSQLKNRYPDCRIRRL